MQACPPQAPHLVPYLVTVEGAPGMSRAAPLRPRIETLRESCQLSSAPDWTGDRWGRGGGQIGRRKGERHREGQRPQGLQSHGKRRGGGTHL